MKKATICYPDGEKTTIEIAGLQDLLQKGDSQQSTANHEDRQTAFFKELQRIDYDYVLVLVDPATESEHDSAYVYVVPVELESGKEGISNEKIRRIVHQVFDLDIGLLRPLHEGCQPAADNDGVFSLESVLVASLPCVHQSINHEPCNSGEAQPLAHSSIREGCNACDGTLTDQVHVQCSSSCQMWRNHGQYNHEEQFQVGSPEEAINQAELNYVLEAENGRKTDHEELEQHREGPSDHNKDACAQREFFYSVSVDTTPAFHSSPNDDFQSFIKQETHNEGATLTHRLSSLSISFDLVPAFLSLTPEDQQCAQPIADGRDSSSRVEMDPEMSPRVPPTYSSRSGQSIQTQCTPPGRANNSLFVFQRPSRPPEGSCMLIPTSKQFSCLPPQSSGNSRQQIRFVYPSPESTRYLLPDVRCDGFPSREELRLVPDCTIIYSSSRFMANTHLLCGVDCTNIFPSPLAIHRAVQRVPIPLQNEFEAHRCSLTPRHSDGMTLPQSAFLGVGGNGVVLKHLLKERKYAVKWTKYNQKELNAWCQLSHPNLVPLCAVVCVIPGCYQVMPRMSGDLSHLVRSDSAGDLCKLAVDADEATWTETLRPNIRFILASILHGLAYLHSQGLQHCDLKESNILFLLKCKCTSILHCKCSPQNKFTIAISDFDSIKPFSSGPLRRVSGTPYYRPPEVYQGLVGPFGDIWSFGIIVCSLCHSCDERQKIIQKCKLMAGQYSPMPNSLPPEELFYSQQILLSLQVKSSRTPLGWDDIVGDVLETRLTSLARIALPCLEYDYKGRPSVTQLLQDPFFHC